MVGGVGRRSARRLVRNRNESWVAGVFNGAGDVEIYDTGAVWDLPQEREQKQSLGTGLRKDNFQLAVAFPIRPGRVDPMFFAGMNF